MDQLLSGAAFGALSGGDSLASGFLVAPEAERMIEELRAFPIEDVGSPAWTRQRENLERLNVQAHHNATTHSDEFVKEFLVSHDKVRVLVHELLVIEAWKDRVFPHFGPDAMDQSMTNMNVYLAHYHEATLCNLLEVTFFHQDACEAAGDDALLELTDYCHRKLVYLNAKAAADAEALAASQDRSADEMLKLRPHQEFEDKARDVRFGTACCALTVLRYLTDYVNQTPLASWARMLDTHDTQMLLVPLLEERPWVRRRKNPSSSGGRPIVEVFSDGRWTEQPREDRLQLTKCDGQTWLALNNLTVDAKCRARYRYDDHRKGTMERVKRHFNEVLFDQLPVLRDLQRVLDEILLMVAPPSHEVTQGRLILEVVPETRDAILKKSDAEWASLASRQLATHFADTPETRAAAAAKVDDMTKMFEFMMEMEDRERAARAPPKRDPPPPEGVVRVEFARTADDGEWYRWHLYDMALDDAKPAKEVEITLDDGSGFAMKGERRTLRPPAPTRSAPARTEKGARGAGGGERGVRRHARAARRKSDRDVRAFARGGSPGPSRARSCSSGRGRRGRRAGRFRAGSRRRRADGGDALRRVGHRGVTRQGRIRAAGEAEANAGGARGVQVRQDGTVLGVRARGGRRHHGEEVNRDESGRGSRYTHEILVASILVASILVASTLARRHHRRRRARPVSAYPTLGPLRRRSSGFRVGRRLGARDDPTGASRTVTPSRQSHPPPPVSARAPPRTPRSP